MSEQNVFDTRKFRGVLGRFATGVAVVTAEVGGVKLSVTVSSFNSVSLEPPLVLFSIARSALGFDLWQQAEHFAVTVLAAHQQELSNRFGRAGGDKWLGIDVARGLYSAPLIPDGLAYFECKVYARYDGGDHQIVVGEVLHFYEAEAAQAAGPLVFYGGRYRHLLAMTES